MKQALAETKQNKYVLWIHLQRFALVLTQFLNQINAEWISLIASVQFIRHIVERIRSRSIKPMSDWQVLE